MMGFLLSGLRPWLAGLCLCVLFSGGSVLLASLPPAAAGGLPAPLSAGTVASVRSYADTVPSVRASVDTVSFDRSRADPVSFDRAFTDTVSSPSYAEPSDSLPVQLLPGVEVTSYHRGRRLLDAPGSVSMVPGAVVAREAPVTLLPLLAQVPGVFAHSGTMSTSRITIRGAGARVPYATGKVRAYFEHIPLTNGSGISIVEHLDPLAVDRIDIVRGPAGSTYGAGLGGTILVRARQPQQRPAAVATTFETGSFGMLRNAVSYDTGSQPLAASIAASRTRHDGHRDNSAYRRDGATAVLHWSPENNTRLTALLSATTMRGEIPSSIDSLLFFTKPRAAAAHWQRTRGYEEVRLLTGGISATRQLGDRLTADLAVFVSSHDEEEVRPFDLLGEERRSGGMRTQINYALPFNRGRVHLTGGMELFLEGFRYRNHENVGGTGESGAMISNNREAIRTRNLFVQGDLEMAAVNLSAGLNLHAASIQYHDLFRAGGRDRSALYRPGTIISPRLGANIRYLPYQALFLSAGHGFSPAALSETLTPEGFVNMDIRPEKSWSLEGGGRGMLWENRLFYDVNLFVMLVSDLLVAERVGADAWVGRNAGAATHRGAETELQAYLVKSEKPRYTDVPRPGQLALLHPRQTGQSSQRKTALAIHQWPDPSLDGQTTPSPPQQSSRKWLFLTGLNLRHVLTLSDFVFTDFSDRGIDYSGNRIPGVPTVAGHTSLTAEWGDILYTVIAHQYTGRMAMNDLNSRFADPYHLFNASGGIKLDIKRWTADLFFRLNNLFDKHHASMILVNAPSFGGAPPRYYYPGLPRHFSSGARLSLRL